MLLRLFELKQWIRSEDQGQRAIRQMMILWKDAPKHHEIAEDRLIKSGLGPWCEVEDPCWCGSNDHVVEELGSSSEQMGHTDGL